MCSYLDEDVMLAKKRYSFEMVKTSGPWRHYLDDPRVISVFLEKVRGMGHDFAREAGL